MLPHILDESIVLTDNISNINLLLDQYGIAVYKLNSINELDKINAINSTKFYTTANNILKDPILEPSLTEKINPSTFKNRKVPDAHSGMVHQYFTPIHHLIHNNIDFQNYMNLLYNNDVKYLPNRLRICNKMKYDNNSLHIEGIDIFGELDGKTVIKGGELAMIVGLTGIRKFVFWDLQNKDILPLKKYCESKGNKEFTKIDPLWMNSNYPDCRREINIDCNSSPAIIIWRENIPHEIALSPSLSLYISPTKTFDKISKCKPNTLQPIEYTNLSRHDSNLLGMCYGLSGGFWPSGKKTYMFCHQRSISHWLPKIKDYYKEGTKLRCKLITNGEINQHSDEFKQKILERNIYLPEIIYNSNMPKINLDITNLSDTILKGYGYM